MNLEKSLFKKILPSYRQLIKKVADINNTGKSISLVSGSFDLLHAGHIKFLIEAKDKADILIVLLNSDQSIKRYKGLNRPIIQEQYRLYSLISLVCVDYVFIFNEINPKKYFSNIKVDYFFNGTDWGKNFVGKDILEKKGTKIIYHKRKSSLSASAIINKILKNNKLKQNHYIFISNNVYHSFFNKTKIKRFLNKLSIKHLIIPKNIAKKDIIIFLENYRKKYNIIFNNSYLISDSITEIEVAKELNLKNIQIIDKKQKPVGQYVAKVFSKVIKYIENDYKNIN